MSRITQTMQSALYLGSLTSSLVSHPLCDKHRAASFIPHLVGGAGAGGIQVSQVP